MQLEQALGSLLQEAQGDRQVPTTPLLLPS
jgi:hypothetical protein